MPAPRAAAVSPTPADIRAARAAAGHTQQQTADLLMVSRRAVQDWERGINVMPPAMLRLYRHLAGIERIPFRATRP